MASRTSNYVRLVSKLARAAIWEGGESWHENATCTYICTLPTSLMAETHTALQHHGAPPAASSCNIGRHFGWERRVVVENASRQVLEEAWPSRSFMEAPTYREPCPWVVRRHSHNTTEAKPGRGRAPESARSACGGEGRALAVWRLGNERPMRAKHGAAGICFLPGGYRGRRLVVLLSEEWVSGSKAMAAKDLSKPTTFAFELCSGRVL